MFASVHEECRTHVFAVGLERFQQPALGAVEYATDSVRAFAENWIRLGLDAGDCVTLIDEEATKTTVESRLRRWSKTVGTGDMVVFVYSGRGAELNGRTLLFAHDTQPDDLEFSALNLDDVLQSIDRCQPGKTVLFLDLANGLRLEPKPDHVIFASCAPSEVSRASGMMKQRLWLHALNQALAGKVKGLIGEIYADQLQNYLQQEVQRLLRTTWDGAESQTPVSLGVLKGFLIAELKLNESQGLQPMLQDSRLLGERHGRVKTLSGFQKQRGHHEPDRHSQAAVKFIQKIGEGEVEQHATLIYERLKAAFGYRHSDLHKTTGEAAASIRTRDFDVDVWLEQDEHERAHYRMVTEVGALRNPEAIVSDAFDEAFQGVCDTLLIELARPFPVAEKIEELEANPDFADCLEYDGEASFVLRLKRPPLRLEVSSDRILIRLAGAGGLAQLIRYSWEALQTLDRATPLLSTDTGNG